MSTHCLRLITVLLWSAFFAYCWHWYTHRPCADIHGKPVIVNGEKGCLEESK